MSVLAGALARAATAGRFVANNGPAIGGVFDTIKNMIPRLEDEAVVEVRGQPGATKRDLYYLALATASSLVRRFDKGFVGGAMLPPPAALMIEYDAADNWVRCTLRYNTNMGVAVGAGLAGASNNVGTAEVFAGPSETTYGAPYNFPPAAVVGAFQFAGITLPTTITNLVPRLPWTQRPVLTSYPVCSDPSPGAPQTSPTTGTFPSPNPKPTGDNRSRGTVQSLAQGVGTFPTDAGNGGSLPNFTDNLIPVVFAALAGPNSTAGMVYPAPTPGAMGG